MEYLLKYKAFWDKGLTISHRMNMVKSVCGGSRTLNLGLTRDLLFQLSYAHFVQAQGC